MNEEALAAACRVTGVTREIAVMIVQMYNSHPSIPEPEMVNSVDVLKEFIEEGGWRGNGGTDVLLNANIVAKNTLIVAS